MFASELRKQKVLFAIADMIALFGAFILALSLHDPSNGMESRLLAADPLLLATGTTLVVGLWVLVFRACNLYQLRNGGVKEAIAIAKACSIATLLTLGLDFLAHIQVSRIAVLIGFVLSVPMVAIARTLLREGIRAFYAGPSIATPLIVVGFNPLAHYLCEQIRDQLNQYEPIGFVDDDAQGRQFGGLPVIGKILELGELSRIYPGLEVAIAMPEAAHETQERIVRICEENRVHWWMVPWILRSPGGIRVEILGVVPLLSPRGSNLEGINFAIKRSFDLLVSTTLLLLASPVMMLTALAVRLFDGSPVLFRQERVGIRGRHFEMLKFRTMRVASADTAHREYVRDWIANKESAAQEDADGEKVHKLVADNRITRIGRILRRFSLDELPQIINVIRGEMSLIGPRPALPYETELYESWHRRRLDVIPGITGLWQISGRNHLTFDQMVRLDVQYMENWSFTSDLRILARTVPVLLRGSGV